MAHTEISMAPETYLLSKADILLFLHSVITELGYLKFSPTMATISIEQTYRDTRYYRVSSYAWETGAEELFPRKIQLINLTR